MVRDRVWTALRIACGVGLIAAGAAMLVTPGPGLLTLATGVALVWPELRDLWPRPRRQPAPEPVYVRVPRS